MRSECGYIKASRLISQRYISANSETLHEVVLRELSVLGDYVSKMSSIFTDGASVMTGKLNGLCARLGQEFPPLISEILRTLKRQSFVVCAILSQDQLIKGTSFL